MLKHDERLKGVNPDLVRVVRRAASLVPFDITVSEGLRTQQRQRELYAKGRTAPGPVVTWTMNSKHLQQADGTGHAVDLYPLIDGAIPTGPEKFGEVAQAMKAAGEIEKVGVVWGADWNHNGRPYEKGEADSPHFQLA